MGRSRRVTKCLTDVRRWRISVGSTTTGRRFAERLGESVVASRADAARLWHRGRPANAKLLHSVGQRCSLHA